MTVKEEHILAAIEGYLKSLSMIHDDDTVVSVKRNRDNTYEVEVEHE
jgi:hypothetical protein